MANKVYPCSPEMLSAIKELQKLAKPLCKCNRCGHKQNVSKREFSTVKGARCSDCGGRLELDEEEADRIKLARSNPTRKVATKQAKIKPKIKSTWSKLPDEYNSPGGAD